MDLFKDLISDISNFFLENKNDLAVEVVAAIIFAVLLFILGRFSSIKNWFTSRGKTMEWRSRYIEEKLALYSDYNTEEAKRLYVPTRYQEERPIMDEVAKPGANNPTGKELIPYFLDNVFKKNNHDRFYCVLADTGMGKTTFLVQLLNAYINKYDEKSLPYDIRILPLADYDVIDQINDLPKSPSGRKSILLLDALDENANAYDRQDKQGNTISSYEEFRKQLELAVERFQFTVITCRIQFFKDEKSELREVKHVQHKQVKRDNSLPGYKTLYISPFSVEDIEEYIGKKYQDDIESQEKAKGIISDIKSLAVRPLILSYIDDLLGGEVNNVLDAYRIIIDKWLQREVNSIGEEDERARQKVLLYDFSRKLAVYIYGHWRETGALYLIQREYEDFKTENPDFDGVDYSFASKSLITRDSQHNILFAHKSFLEYFCAEQLLMGKFPDFYFPGMDMAKTFFELFCQADEDELLPDENEIDKAWRFNEIGQVYQYKIGDYDKALEYYFKALEIREKELGKEHPNTATSYNNIGYVYYCKGDYDNALKYLKEALKIREKELGKEHPDTAQSYNNIGNVYYSKADYDKALEYYFKAKEIREKVLGKEHPETATTYNNIGSVYHRKSNYDKALEYYIKTLEICEKVLGKEHPDTAQTINNIGSVYYRKINYDKALKYYFKALEIREKVLGKKHPNTATTYNDISLIYSDKGDYDNALKYLKNALEIREKVLGKEHPDTAQTINNIGSVYHRKSNYDKALEYHKEALEILEQKLGPKHPLTRATYHNIGIVYEEMENKDEAQKWFDKARK